MTAFTYENIYVAVDGSQEAEFAFEKAVGIAKRNVGSRLYLIHIVDQRATIAMDYADGANYERAVKYAEEMLSTYQQRAVEYGVADAQIMIEQGSPKQALVKKFSTLSENDLVICGATGLNRIERFLIGSVSDNIIRSSSCDVLVVRTPERFLT